MPVIREVLAFPKELVQHLLVGPRLVRIRVRFPGFSLEEAGDFYGSEIWTLEGLRLFWEEMIQRVREGRWVGLDFEVS